MATTFVRVEYATSEVHDLTYPTTWYFLARTATSGHVRSPPRAGRKRVWFRQRTEKHGFAPTPWVLAGSVIVEPPAQVATVAHIAAGSALFEPSVS